MLLTHRFNKLILVSKQKWPNMMLREINRGKGNKQEDFKGDRTDSD